VLDQRGQLLRAAVGFAGCSMPSYDRALHALRTWLDSWSGIGHVTVGMARQGYDLRLTRYGREGLARDLLHDGDGALAHERDGHRVGAHAMARDAAGDVAGPADAGAVLNPSEIAGLAAYPALLHLFQQHIDMQFADIRAMMRFPVPPEFQAGFNLAAASRLMEMVSGFSVILYADPYPYMPPTTSRHNKSGRRFQHLILDCWPHGAAVDPPRHVISEMLYYFTRNPLTHSLGLRQPGEPQIGIAKNALTPAQIEQLEREPALPGFVAGRPLQVMGLNAYRINVRGLYWATYRLMENLVATLPHAPAAELAIANRTWIP
jgi:hypothetical protein